MFLFLFWSNFLFWLFLWPIGCSELYSLFLHICISSSAVLAVAKIGGRISILNFLTGDCCPIVWAVLKECSVFPLQECGLLCSIYGCSVHLGYSIVQCQCSLVFWLDNIHCGQWGTEILYCYFVVYFRCSAVGNICIYIYIFTITVSFGCTDLFIMSFFYYNVLIGIWLEV